MTVSDDTEFAGYRIERRLGAGGMGEVFLARHPRLPRNDALKILSDRHAGDAEFRARFLREAEVAVRLQHPNVVAVRDRGEHEDQLWIAMQFVDGGDVAELLRHEGALPVERALRILTEAADGLDEIHRVGLQHRDVKPANLLLTTEPGEPDRVLVTDFGIARAADGDGTLSEDVGFTATLAYAAPELISGDPVDHRADVYSLGCTLYQLLTGEVPFPRSSPAAVMYAHLSEPPPRPSAVNSRVPAALDDVIATAMAKDPAERYPSCGALAAAAHAACAPADGSSSRTRWVVATAIAATVAVAVGGSLMLGFGRDTAPSASEPTGVANAESWGAARPAAETLPRLLPVTPAALGYQDMHDCLRVDSDGNPLTFDREADVSGVQCLGDRDPVLVVSVLCRADRAEIAGWTADLTVEGEQTWARDGGTGKVRWGSYTTDDGRPTGRLDAIFDGPERHFCRLRVSGGSSGTELWERWWPDAPLGQG